MELRRKNIVEDDKEYAILVGIDSKTSLQELEELAHACHIEVVGQFFQNRSKADKVLFLGPGKAKDRKSTRLNSSHANISYAVFCLKKKKKATPHSTRTY